ECGSIGIWDYNIPMDRIEIYNHIGNKKYLIESSKSFIEQIAREDVRVLTESFRNISKTNDQFNIDIRLAKNGDASVRWFCMKGKAIEFDKQDKPVRIVGTMEDLSVRKDLEKEIMGKNKELKLMIDVANEACQAKSKFLANMSHEIRTPLNGIMLAVNGIKKESLSKNQTKLFSIIENSCTLLNGIVSEILDFSKIERGKVSVADEKVDMSGILQNAVNEIQMAANQKGLETSFYFDPRVQRQFWGDAQKTKQILNNLISNAVKFTYEGGIGLKAKLISEDETHVKILFEVKDSGIGIKTEMQDKVFEPFFQSEETSAKPSPGTGLGLLISKKYAEAMGGDLTFESQEKKGSIFRFQCSFRKEVIAGSILGEPEVMEQPVPKQEDRLEPIDKKRVLCVEDNMVNQELLVATLEEAGYYVDAAFSASEALNCMLENRPDIILMDIQLPLKSGYELAEEIKSMSEYREIPIIAVTAYARKEDRGKCLKAGMVDYVVKPIKIDELFEKIEKYIG
ncbi:MAG TPA: response regulator, partial [Lachnospiraceae bacterium]|nr:response regulator [Lachnospiraceae bacterium]